MELNKLKVINNKKKVYLYDIFDDDERCKLDKGYVVAKNVEQAEKIVRNEYNKCYETYRYLVYEDLEKDKCRLIVLKRNLLKEGKRMNIGLYDEYESDVDELMC